MSFNHHQAKISTNAGAGKGVGGGASPLLASTMSSLPPSLTLSHCLSGGLSLDQVLMAHNHAGPLGFCPVSPATKIWAAEPPVFKYRTRCSVPSCCPGLVYTQVPVPHGIHLSSLTSRCGQQLPVAPGSAWPLTPFLRSAAGGRQSQS